MELTIEQNRKYIDDRCRAYDMVPIDNTIACILSGCLCPFNDDPDAWCKRCNLEDVPNSELDAIVEKFRRVRNGM